MGKSLITQPESVRRARRLSLFCREVKRALFGICLDKNTPSREIDFFIEDLFQMMDFQAERYPLEKLLSMLLDDQFINEAYLRYCDRLT